MNCTESISSQAPVSVPARRGMNWQFCLALLGLIFASFPSVLLGRTTWVSRDFGLFSYPAALFQKQSFWQGHIPLWNPYNYCGIPFLAQWNTMVLYPPTLIYLVFPLTWSLPLFCLLHLYLGGVGMFMLAKEWTNSDSSAALAGVIFAFNGLSLNLLMWPSHIATFAWAPWVIWLVPAAWNRRKHPICGILVGSLQMLSGAPETILFTWIIIVVLGATQFFQDRNLRRDIGIVLPTTAALVAAISAAQLLPFLELLLQSQRDAGYASSANNWAMPIWGWANFLVPLFRTNETSGGVHLQNAQYWTSSYYAGVASPLLVGAALYYVKESRVRLLSVVLLCSLVLAWGDSTLLYGLLTKICPLLGFVRYSIKFVIPALIVLPLLVAYGLKGVSSKAIRKTKIEVILLLILLGTIGLICLSDSSAPEQIRRQTLLSGISRSLVLVIAFTLIVALKTPRLGVRNVLVTLLCVLFWIDFETHTSKQNPEVSATIYSKAEPTLPNSLAVLPSAGRVYIDARSREYLSGNALHDPAESFIRNLNLARPDANILSGRYQVDGFYSLFPRRMNTLVNRLCYERKPVLDNLSGFMGVSAIMTNPVANGEWSRTRFAMPTVTGGQEPEFMDDKETLSKIISDECDFRTRVLLPEETKRTVDTKGTQMTFKNVVLGRGGLSVDVDAAEVGVMILAQTFYPGWEATVDGRKTEIIRANYAFQGVRVPKGTHAVEVRFRSGSFRLGLLISMLAVCGCAIWWVLSSRQRASS